jgi:hypothetical protein
MTERFSELETHNMVTAVVDQFLKKSGRAIVTSDPVLKEGADVYVLQAVTEVFGGTSENAFGALAVSIIKKSGDTGLEKHVGDFNCVLTKVGGMHVWSLVHRHVATDAPFPGTESGSGNSLRGKGAGSLLLKTAEALITGLHKSHLARGIGDHFPNTMYIRAAQPSIHFFARRMGYEPIADTDPDLGNLNAEERETRRGWIALYQKEVADLHAKGEDSLQWQTFNSTGETPSFIVARLIIDGSPEVKDDILIHKKAYEDDMLGIPTDEQLQDETINQGGALIVTGRKIFRAKSYRLNEDWYSYVARVTYKKKL